MSIVRNCAYIFYSFRKSSLGFSIIKLPIVRDYACIFLRLWENQCMILNDKTSNNEVFCTCTSKALGKPVYDLYYSERHIH
jgi:hypothetical protein